MESDRGSLLAGAVASRRKEQRGSLRSTDAAVAGRSKRLPS